MQKACLFAEELLRQALQVHTGNRPDVLDQALADVTGGKKKPLKRLTLGQYVQIIVSLDGKRRLVPGQRVVSKADKMLLERLSGSRNRFVHGRFAAPVTEDDMRSFLEDVARVCSHRLIEAAIQLETNEASIATGRSIERVAVLMAWLNKGRILTSNVTGRCYRVASERIAQGGFGEVYGGFALDNHRDRVARVVIKASIDPHTWHGEGYFGRLLADQPHVVRLHNAFPVVDGRGRAQQTKYILIFDWMEEGTVADSLARAPEPWPEEVVVEQVRSLLRVLALLHARGICHADITPRNVFVDGERLILGDLGIAKQSLREGPIEMDYGAPSIFVPPDAYAAAWTPSDDVYQLGLIALSLLAGEIVVSNEVCGRALKRLVVSDATKGWIRDALEDRHDRFRDAGEALDARLGSPTKPAPNPRSLRGQHVVFTGRLAMRREEAKSRATKAGAIVQTRVNGQTSLVVAGQPNPLMIGQRRGTKLFDAYRRMRRGQRIAIIDKRRFRDHAHSRPALAATTKNVSKVRFLERPVSTAAPKSNNLESLARL